jgi:hypothetical protein
MKSLCTITLVTKNLDKQRKVTSSQKDRVDLIWLVMEHVSIEILCHLYSFFLEYKTVNKNFFVNSKTELLA